MEHLDMSYMGPLLQAARLKKNFTQDALAEQVGITNRYVSAIENEGKCPSLDVWIRIVRALQTSADAIVYPEQPIEQDDPLIRMIQMLSERDRKIITAIAQTMLDEPNAPLQQTDTY